ncbi:MAG: hypothetical protein HOJ35_01940, partial [Bdellovibrionales bacterium]|nr:hypothetical protein [Bdellovibrionales bacterium]
MTRNKSILLILLNLFFLKAFATDSENQDKIREAYSTGSNTSVTTFTTTGGALVPRPDSNDVTYIPHSPSTYNQQSFPTDTSLGYDSNWGDGSWSGSNLGDRCNFYGATDSCGSGYKCTQYTYQKTGSNDYEIQRWDDHPNECYIDRPCNIAEDASIGVAEQDHESARADCNTHSANPLSCINKDTTCRYKINCLYSYDDDYNAFYGNPCEKDYNCSSGYCISLDDPPTKMCAPFARCAKTCKDEGQTLSTADDWCCEGLQINSNNTCYDPFASIPAVPDDINYSVNSINCTGYFFEGTNQSDKEIVLEKFWSYQRLMHGLIWTWGKANNPKGKDDLFYINKVAKTVGESILEKQNEIENEYVYMQKELEEKLEALKGTDEDEENQTRRKTSHSLAGVEFFNVMGEDFQHKAQFDLEQASSYSSMYNELSTLLLKINNPQSYGPPSSSSHKEKLRYNRYGKYPNRLHWPSLGDFSVASSSICGIRFQKNKHCVREMWKVDGHPAGKDNVLDPFYPKSIVDGISFYSENAAGVSAADVAIFVAATIAGGPFGAIAAGLLGDLFAEDWLIPRVTTDFNNNYDSLVDKIYSTYKNFADSTLESTDPSKNTYNQENNIHRVNLDLDPAEIRIKLRKAYTIVDLTDEEITEIISEATPEFRRELLLRIISKMIANIIVIYGADNNKTITASSKRKSVEMFQEIATYLEKFHYASSQMYSERATCMFDKANVISTSYDEAGAGGSSLSTSSVVADATEAVESIAPTEVALNDCSEGNCNEETDLVMNKTITPDMGSGSNTVDTYDAQDVSNDTSSSTTSSSSSLAEELKKELDARDKDALARRNELIALNESDNDHKTSSDKVSDFLDHIDGPKAFSETLKQLQGTFQNNPVSAPKDEQKELEKEQEQE